MGGPYRTGDSVVTCGPSTYQQSVIRLTPTTTMTTPSAGSSGLRSAPLHTMDTSEVLTLTQMMPAATDDLDTPVPTPHAQEVAFSSPGSSVFDSPGTILGLRPSQTEAERRAGEEALRGARDDDGATGDDARRRRDDGNDDNV